MNASHYRLISICWSSDLTGATLFFSNRYAQTWWKIIGPSNHAESIPKWVNSYIANLEINGELNDLDKIQEALK
jgi:hypothetical protein